MTAAAKNIDKAKRGRPSKKGPSAGPIEEHAVYALDDFKARTRWSDTALRTARRRGLRVITDGNVAFVRGADFCEYIKNSAGRPTGAK
jgi:hypothetical protein